MPDNIKLALALENIARLEKLHEENSGKIEKLERWKQDCTVWAAWWAGVCACVMAAATLIRTYWDDIKRVLGGHP